MALINLFRKLANLIGLQNVRETKYTYQYVVLSFKLEGDQICNDTIKVQYSDYEPVIRLRSKKEESNLIKEYCNG